MKEIKEKIIERSANGIRALTRLYKAMRRPPSNSSKLDVDDFRWGLLDYGVNI